MGNQKSEISQDARERRADYGFLGVGGCGGNITRLFGLRGYQTFYVNSSREDLASLEGVPEDLKYHLQGGSGTAQDRKVSKRLFKENLEQVCHAVSQSLRVKLLFLAGSMGGGTGSGALPVLARFLKTRLGIPVVVVAVMPADNESYQKRINAYEFLTELEQGHEGAAIILDNNARKDPLTINEIFAIQLDGLLANDSHDARGNLDRQELYRLFSARGMSVLSMLSPMDQNVRRLREALETGIYAPMEADKVVSHIGLIQTENPTIKPEELHVFTGNPITDYLGYGAGKCICILSGLSLPYTRIQTLYENALREKEELQRRLAGNGKPRLKPMGESLELDLGSGGEPGISDEEWFKDISF